MSTHSNIGILNNDGTVTFVYCHFDGYPDHVGKTLVRHYNTEDKVRELLSYGEISSLNSTIGTKHELLDLPKNQCTFYHRDNDEKLNIGTEILEARFFRTGSVSYKYLFYPQTNQWVCKGTSGKEISLEKYIEQV